MADGGGLENRYGARVSSWVRIPHPPLVLAKTPVDLRVHATRDRRSVAPPMRLHAVSGGLMRPAVANTRPSLYVSHRRLCGYEIQGADRVSSGSRKCSALRVRGAQGCGNVLVVDTGGDQGRGGISSSPTRRRTGRGRSGLPGCWRKTGTRSWCRRGISCRAATGSRACRKGSPGRRGRSPCCHRPTWSRSTGPLSGRPRGPAIRPAQQRKLLVVRVTDCDRPGLLAGVVSVDLFGMTEAEARARLRTMVSAAVTGRAKPEAAPRFPGGRAMPREPRFPGRAAEGVEGPGP